MNEIGAIKVPSEPSIGVQLLAGGFSAVVAKTATAPLERIRIIQQTVQSNRNISAISLIRDITKDEGLAAFWRGNLPAVIRIFPTYALRLTLFERFKDVFGKKDSFAGGLLSGCASSFVTTAVTYPLDVLRTRMATDRGQRGVSFREAYVVVKASRGLYKGITINMIEAVPYVGISLASYDAFKRNFIHVPHWCSAITTGLLATGVCFPLDTLRRYLVVNHETTVSVGIRELWEQGRIKRFYRGLPVSLVKSGPTVGLILTLNDEIKRRLSSS